MSFILSQIYRHTPTLKKLYNLVPRAIFRFPLIAKRCAGDEVESYITSVFWSKSPLFQETSSLRSSALRRPPIYGFYFLIKIAGECLPFVQFCKVTFTLDTKWTQTGLRLKCRWAINIFNDAFLCNCMDLIYPHVLQCPLFTPLDYTYCLQKCVAS